jgi:alkaline phosphatase
VKNAPAVRKVLEGSGKVIAVFQGHNHHGAYRRINGIPYFTMRGMVEGPGLKNNAYAVVRISPDGAIGIRGFGEQPSYPAR